ncbi:phospholipase A [Herbaspirillum sp. GCM10030257]|uniref:phospholipase A n=1 Tax=Herbaspirillum sp. GCM10030257 TaxID=3273393 RepID=UPI00360FF184
MEMCATDLSASYALAVLLMFGAIDGRAAGAPTGLQDCAGIVSDSARLLCYDRLAGKPDTQGTSAAQPSATRPGAAMALPASGEENKGGMATSAASESSHLTEHWELGESNKRGIFRFRPHHENYLVATYNSAPNQDPYRPFRAFTPEAKGLAHSELAFQLGFKLKIAENVADKPIDVWFGYTQRSFWQAGNAAASSPFRETDYQPEVMAVVPVDINLLGLRLRMLNLGLLHQSNGQASTLSRSWNRAYLQAAFEHGNFDLSARIWKRFNEAASDDNNPRIIDYMGRGDLVGTYRWNGHKYSLLTRYNFHTDKGAAQVSWAFPLTSKLKGYVQYFTGYGYTLIDYDDFQRVLGIGLQVDY